LRYLLRMLQLIANPMVVRRVDWAAHEQDLINRYRMRCEGQPYHSPTFQAAHGIAPVTHWPRAVQLLSSARPKATQRIAIHNNSTTNVVRYSLEGNEFPGWVSVAPAGGFIKPEGDVVIEATCHYEDAEAR
jgi:hypothetical protein